MLQSMANGASALNAFQSSINVESNNAANLNTTGFKSDSISFSDMMYDRGVGMGSFMDDPRKDFSQGGIKPTNSEYDFAIKGEGFFTLQDPQDTNKYYYTRTGQFKSNKENFMTTDNGMVVMGIKPVVTGDIITSEYVNSIGSTTIDTADSTYTLNTYATDYEGNAKKIAEVIDNLTAIEAYNAGSATQEQTNLIEKNPDLLEYYTSFATQSTAFLTAESGNGYKSIDTVLSDISETIYQYKSSLKALSINPIEGDIATKSQSSVTFTPSSIAVEDDSVEIQINGIKIQQSYENSSEYTLKTFSDKINEIAGVTSTIDTVTGELLISGVNSGESVYVTNAKMNNSNIPVIKLQEATGSGQNLVDALYVDLQSSLEKLGATSTKNKSEIANLATGDTLSLEPIVLDLNTLGLSSVLYEKLISGDENTIASYPGITSEDGNIYLNDGDAQFLVGKLSPVTFGDLTQLKPEGDNIYSKGDGAGEPLYIANSATVVGKYLENSNVDISKELVNLMAFQKAYEANSKSISTSDELLKTALALKTK